MTPLLTAELADFLEGPVSIYVGTRDGELRPRASRVWALRVSAKRDRVTAFGHEQALRLHLPNLESNGQMALCVARPSDDRAYQVKGSFVSWRACKPADRKYVDGQVQALWQNLELIGIPRSTFASWSLWPSLALSLKVTEVFAQTPGPAAGEAVS